jgi:hypothetical protein
LRRPRSSTWAWSALHSAGDAPITAPPSTPGAWAQGPHARSAGV